MSRQPDPGTVTPSPDGMTAEENQMFMFYKSMLERISGPLLKALKEGRSGGEFAEDLANFDDDGETLLRGIKALSPEPTVRKDLLVKIIMMHAPLWNQIQAKYRPQFDVFLDGFLGFDPDSPDAGEVG